MSDFNGSNTPPEQCDLWVPINGYEGLYEVSSAGVIRSLPRVDRFGRSIPGVVLKLYKHSSGYSSVGLCKCGVKTQYLVHRIVASNFIGQPPEGFVANHINGNKKDNRVENLEWCSMADNNKHAHRTGLNYIFREEQKLHLRTYEEKTR